MTIASIDIGTNTVLLLIAEVHKNKQLKTILNEYRIPRIGKGLLPGGEISENKIKELLNVLKAYREIIARQKCEKIIITATNAMRIAANRNEIIIQIRNQFGWNVNIVSGEEEARLSYIGATSNLTGNETAMVIDIGGGSTELIFGRQKEILYIKSFQTGVVSGTEKYLMHDPPFENEVNQFKEHLSHIFGKLNNFESTPQMAIALAGTPTTLACIDLSLDRYDEELIEGHCLMYDNILRIRLNIQQLTSYQIKRSYKSMVNGREDLMLAGTCILLKIMELTKIDKVRVSTKGIRYGAIIKEIIDYK
jgi:exopolyphosphatase / guanosine-5'-triphosphate,3'-diphosphate pyrophosphatase